ncbi:MAG: EAL domain-containing protein [Candidatus Competibacteraceae bacterium]|nr:EAL domain-containing protein [Candidatus Competibacteraceae bacterium]
MELKPARNEPLAGKIQRIEDLAEKLVYIKWSREFFVLLQRATQELLALARPRPEYQKLVVLAARLEEQLGECLDKGELPKGTQRERLIAIVDALCRLAPPGENAVTVQNLEGSNQPSEALTTPLLPRWDQEDKWLPPASDAQGAALESTVWLVASEKLDELARKLEQRGGFQLRRCGGLNEIRQLLAESQKPLALIIDLDHSTDNQAIMQQISTLRQLLPAEAPILFLADRGDITARLEAVEAGGSGYFLKPVDLPLLLDALDEQVLSRANHRILIVDDNLPSAREIARWLEGRGLVTQVLAQPLQILQALRNFHPSLLIMSLDLKETDGLILAQATQQHEQFRELPTILLSAQTDIGQRLSVAGLSGEALLGKPLNPEALHAAVSKRLRQGPGLYRKFSQLNNRDTVSGLYNRPYFLTRLDRVLVASTANTQSVAVMLISLNNLRAIEAMDAAAADEIVEHAARRLQATLGVETIAARFGDALFSALLGFNNQDALLASARAAQASLENQPYRLNANEHQLRTSIGISIVNPAKPDAALLIQQADLACGMARDSKDTRIYIHHSASADQEADHPRQHKLLEEVREAVQQQRMNLLFQPIVSLRGDTTERYEVLLRMRNRDGWELLPETIFGLVKRHRIGMVLDRWVIAHSIRLLRERRSQGRNAILFINISPTVLQDEELFSWLQGGLSKTQVPAASLVFEIAETTAEVNKPTLMPFLKRIKDLGCGLSLDHFSGHERSQALAQSLQVDYVKLDSRYAQDLHNDRTRQQELSVLARQLATQGVTTILTGIEDTTTVPVLWSCGIDYVQGFLLQRPHTDMSFDFEHVVL